MIGAIKSLSLSSLSLSSLSLSSLSLSPLSFHTCRSNADTLFCRRAEPAGKSDLRADECAQAQADLLKSWEFRVGEKGTSEGTEEREV